MLVAVQASLTVEVTTRDGVADVHVARPDHRARPGVLFVMDAYGLRPAIEEIAHRIAADGYVVLAPNVFYRAGRSPVLPLPDLTDAKERTRFFQSLRPLSEELRRRGWPPTAAPIRTISRTSRRRDRSQSPATAWAHASAGE